MSQQLNLFNPVFLRQKKYFSARTMVQALVIVLVVLVGLYAFARVQVARIEQQLADAEQQFNEAQRQLAQYGADARRAPSRLLDDEIARAEAQVKAQEELLESLASGALGNTDGFSRYLTALARQTVSGVWLTGFVASGTEGPLSIRGRLLRPELLPAYLRMLNREEVLRGRGFSELRLVAREEKSAPASAAHPEPGLAPTRYVEFTLAAPKGEGAK